jgi:hypothetical protein
LRERGRNSGSPRLRAAATGVAGAALAALLAACGSTDPAPKADAEAHHTYHLAVVRAELPTEQRLGQTSLLRIGVRNTGRSTVPAVTITPSIAGKAGEESTLAFGVRDRQPGLSFPDRPVWVLAQGYPRRAGSSESAGAETSGGKTFDFGALKPGETTEGVWKLSAVRAGRYTLRFSVGGGLGGAAKTVSAGGARPGGSFDVTITSRVPDLEVTDSGKVVEVGAGKGGGSGKGGVARAE